MSATGAFVAEDSHLKIMADEKFIVIETVRNDVTGLNLALDIAFRNLPNETIVRHTHHLE